MMILFCLVLYVWFNDSFDLFLMIYEEKKILLFLHFEIEIVCKWKEIAWQ